jgi:hypothetical protein
MGEYGFFDEVLREIAPNPRRDHRRNQCIATLVLTPEVNNTLIAEVVDEATVALAVAYRARDGQIVTGEITIASERWSGATFKAYAREMSKQPN